jgi:hypothetical protein
MAKITVYIPDPKETPVAEVLTYMQFYLILSHEDLSYPS